MQTAQTTVETGYRPREHQLTVHNGRKRFSVLVCHRRFGKTVLGVNELQHTALSLKRENVRVGYLAPFLSQAKAIAWDYAKRFAAPIPGVKINESELRIDYPHGARFRLYGADNADALRGQYFDDIFLDEFAQIAPSVWSEVIRPALADRNGWALFGGTPKGRNAFYDIYEQARKLQAAGEDWAAFMFRASDTNVIAPAELAALKAQMAEEEYDQEFECSFYAALVGAYYGKEMQAVEREHRIGKVEALPGYPIETWWDLGVDDATAIWMVQPVGSEFRVLAYYENRSHGVEHYTDFLKAIAAQRGWTFGRHILPHDGAAREWGTGLTRIETMQRHMKGQMITSAPQQRVEDGINAVRQILPRCVFDETGTAATRDHKGGLEVLRQYERAWDEKLGVFRSQPLHNWASHGADAFRTGALMWRMTPPKSKEPPKTRDRWSRSEPDELSWKVA